MTAKDAAIGAAKLAATAAVPELAIPAEILEGLLNRRPRPQTSSQTVLQGGPQVVTLPPDPLLVLRKSRIRTIYRDGTPIVIITPARGVRATEVLAVAVVGGIAYGAWIAAQAIQSDISALKTAASPASWFASLNPMTWKL